MKFLTSIIIMNFLISSFVVSTLIKKNNLNRIKTKVATQNNKTFKVTLTTSDFNDDTFGKVDKYTGDDHFVVLKLKDLPEAPTGLTAKSSIGVLKTEKFYFLFPWETCYDNETIDFSKLTGLVELAHGTNQKLIFTLNPFTPPGKHIWKLHHTAPFGTVSVGPTDYNMLSARIFGSSVIDFTKDEPTAVHSLWDLMDQEITDKHKDFVHTTTKTKNSRKKYVSGTNNKDNHAKVMDLELSKFRTGEKFKSEHLPRMLAGVRICTTIGFVITRNRKFSTPYLSNLLSDINDYSFPTNLLISSCRYRTPEKDWQESWNLGPKAYYALGEKDEFQPGFAFKYGESTDKKVDFTE